MWYKAITKANSQLHSKTYLSQKHTTRENVYFLETNWHDLEVSQINCLLLYKTQRLRTIKFIFIRLFCLKNKLDKSIFIIEKKWGFIATEMRFA